MTRPHKFKAQPGWHDENLKPCGKEAGIYYFRSRLEVSYAGTLEIKRRAGLIDGWEYEPEKWDFNERVSQPFRMNSTFTPDFRIWKTDRDGRKNYHYVEVTGPLYSGKMVKIRRAIKLFPERELRVYTSRWGSQDAAWFDAKIKSNEKRKKLIKKLKKGVVT